MSTAYMRTVSKLALPRVPLARIPMVAFASAHPSAYSSSAWVESKPVTDKLNIPGTNLASEAEKQASNLSQYASDAIRMLESHSVHKQDKAAIHAYRDVDHGEARFAKH
ncbi:hypothetical protein BGW38_007455 [Lunasporangiospora selenospora]|uniref:Uncharacterized protein n=1 Tax=Lunasporangiospora selenospora TaxID=979761 RepID=A0A9P6FMD7_9FUNG|nr:hypothetical protein BGW38_007455 [Lunasporangiospora selenospora]